MAEDANKRRGFYWATTRAVGSLSNQYRPLSHFFRQNLAW